MKSVDNSDYSLKEYETNYRVGNESAVKVYTYSNLTQPKTWVIIIMTHLLKGPVGYFFQKKTHFVTEVCHSGQLGNSLEFTTGLK